jgi:hypothetical protein
MAYGEASNAVLNNEAGAVQGEISDILRDEIIDFLATNDLKATSEEFGISEEDLVNDYEINDMIEYYKEQRDEAPTEGVDQSLNEDFVPDYTATAKYEGPGRDEVTITEADLEMDPNLVNMVGATGKANALKGMFSRAASKVPRAGKAVQVTPKDKFTSSANSKHIVKNKNFDKAKPKEVTKDAAMSNARKAELTTAGGLTTGLGLMGNRNKDGDFVKVDLGRPEPILIDEVPQETTPETMGNQYGYHKQEGQNFWTVNNDDAYWDTHEMGTGDAWSDAEVKKAPAKELDWSSWFN